MFSNSSGFSTRIPAHMCTARSKYEATSRSTQPTLPRHVPSPETLVPESIVELELVLRADFCATFHHNEAIVELLALDDGNVALLEVRVERLVAVAQELVIRVEAHEFDGHRNYKDE